MSSLHKLFAWLFKPPKIEVPPTSLCEETIKILDDIDINKLKSVFSIDLTMTTMEVMYLNVEDYTKNLTKAAIRILNGKDYVFTDLYGSRNIYIREFFISRDRRYLDINQSFPKFREAARHFLEIYNDMSKKDIKSPLEENILRQSYSIMNDLCSVIRILYNVQSDKEGGLR